MKAFEARKLTDENVEKNNDISGLMVWVYTQIKSAAKKGRSFVDSPHEGTRANYSRRQIDAIYLQLSTDGYSVDSATRRVSW